jgi:hypothetical protein
MTQSRDIVIRLFRAAQHRTAESEARERRSEYFDAAIYSELRLEIEGTPPNFRYHPSLSGLPLAGMEHVTLDGAGYEGDHASFIEGESSMRRMRERLLGSLSTNLRRLLTEPPSDIRVWWSSSTPEIDALPWELVAGPDLRRVSRRVVFLRGVPPRTPIPGLPVTANPRLATVCRRHLVPEWALVIERRFSEYVTVIDAPLRDGIAEAVRAGYELLHIFTDAIVSSACDGILYDAVLGAEPGRQNEAELHPGELSRMLSGSRVALLSLSCIRHSSAEVQEFAGRRVLSAYRAFAYLGATSLPIPTTLAELGPIPDAEMASFWERFYSELMPGWHLTESLRKAQELLPFAPPVALFCRHAGGKLFRRADAGDSNQLMQVRKDLLLSEQLTRELSALSQKYGEDELPGSIANFLRSADSRKTRLRSELESWTDTSEEL